jgi:hypothetical protein
MAEPSSLGLSQEIRNEIYRLLLVSAKPLRIDHSQNGERLPTNILRANKQVFSEAFQTLLKKNEFNCSLGDSFPTSFKNPISPQEAVLLQAYRLSIRLPPRGHLNPLDSLQLLARFVARCKNLTHLRLDFQFDIVSYLTFNVFATDPEVGSLTKLPVLKSVAFKVANSNLRLLSTPSCLYTNNRII